MSLIAWVDTVKQSTLRQGLRRTSISPSAPCFDEGFNRSTQRLRQIAQPAGVAAAKAAIEEEQARQAARKTVDQLFEHWAKIDLINRKDGGAEVRRMFEKDVLPFLGKLAVDEVKKGHITEVTDALLARGVTPTPPHAPLQPNKSGTCWF